MYKIPTNWYQRAQTGPICYLWSTIYTGCSLGEQRRYGTRFSTFSTAKGRGLIIVVAKFLEKHGYYIGASPRTAAIRKEYNSHRLLRYDELWIFHRESETDRIKRALQALLTICGNDSNLLKKYLERGL